MRIRKPEGVLGWVSALWVIAGVAGAGFFVPKGTVAGLVFALVSVGIAMMSAALWLGIRSVRIPFTIYWTMIAASGVALLLLGPVTIEAIGEIVLFGYFAFLVYYWDPDDQDITQLHLNDHSA